MVQMRKSDNILLRISLSAIAKRMATKRLTATQHARHLWLAEHSNHGPSQDSNAPVTASRECLACMHVLCVIEQPIVSYTC